MKKALIDGLLPLLPHLQSGVSILSAIINSFRNVNKRNCLKFNYNQRSGDKEINLNIEFEKVEKKNN